MGLSDKEIEIYLAGLKFEQATIQKLLEATNIKRSTIYIVLERLKQRGLVSQVLKNRKKVFEMATPEKLLEIAQKEKEKAARQEKDIKRIFSELKNLSKKPQFVTDIKIYEGFGGIRDILREFVKIKNPSYAIYSSHYLNKLEQSSLAKTIAEIEKTRRKSRNKISIITNPNPISVRFYGLEETDIREFRFLPENIKLPAMLDICGDKIALSYLSEPCGTILIQNEMISQMTRLMFDIIWQSLEGKNLPSAELIEESKKIQLK